MFYLTRIGQPRYAPKDTEYFSILQDFVKIYSPQKIYDDFNNYYEVTDKRIYQT